MRTALFLLAGILLVGATAILARLFAHDFSAAPAVATGVFLLVWLMVTGFNLWVGVARAGYSVGQELPILLLLFGVPAVLALVLKWKLL